VDFDRQYRETAHRFGSEPAPILQRYVSLLPQDRPVLDVGAGQGRNTLFLARRGFRVDAIDPSAVAFATTRELAAAEQLPVNTFHCGFDAFEPGAGEYGAVLLFGLIPILSREAISHLVQFAAGALCGGGLVFVTAFTTDDESCARCARNGHAVGRNSYAGPDGDIRTFLDPGEINSIFAGFTVTHHWEGLGPMHRHGQGPIEQHVLVEAVLKRPPR
jgi:tellurite methyltransferase